jgi:hypothetical protein
MQTQKQSLFKISPTIVDQDLQKRIKDEKTSTRGQPLRWGYCKPGEPAKSEKTIRKAFVMEERKGINEKEYSVEVLPAGHPLVPRV